MSTPNYDELFSDITSEELTELLEDEPKSSALATILQVAIITSLLVLI